MVVVARHGCWHAGPAPLLARRLLKGAFTLKSYTFMNLADREFPYADMISVPSELSFDGNWDGEAVSALIRSKSADGEIPAFLFLGRKEAALLKEHLAEIFGDEAVTTLNRTYYKGLEVVTIDCDSFLATGGSKPLRTLQDPLWPRSAARDIETENLWRLRI